MHGINKNTKIVYFKTDQICKMILYRYIIQFKNKKKDCLGNPIFWKSEFCFCYYSIIDSKLKQAQYDKL